MTGQFDEAFYRNKRAALVSSVILILANASSIHVDKGAAFYIFKISPVGDWTIIFFLLLVCAYLNLSYLLQYRTEVPAWRRNPENGLQQVEAPRKSLDESKQQGENEQAQIAASQKDMANHLDVLSNSLENFVAKIFLKNWKVVFYRVSMMAWVQLECRCLTS